MKTYYYVSTIKNATTALTNWFRDIDVHAHDKDGNLTKIIRVPIMLGPINKADMDRTEQHSVSSADVEMMKRYYQTSPRLAMMLNGVSLATDRIKSPNDWRNIYGFGDIDSLLDYQPTPHNLSFSLQMKSHSYDYLCQIIESIIPYFSPAKKLRIKEFPFINIERDYNVVCDGTINPEWGIPINISDRKRDITASLPFTVEAFTYRPLMRDQLVDIIELTAIDDDSKAQLKKRIIRLDDIYNPGDA